MNKKWIGLFLAVMTAMIVFVCNAAIITRLHSDTIVNGQLANATDISDELNGIISELNAKETRLDDLETGSMVISGNKTLSGTNTHSGTNTFSSTVNFTGQANHARATDPGTPVNGDIWYNSTGHAYKGYRNGATKSFLMAGDDKPVSAVTARSSNTILGVSDNSGMFVCTSTFTQTFTAAATLGSSWSAYIKNEGTGIITLDPDGSETIDNQTTINVYPGEEFMVVSDGSNFKTVGRSRGWILINSQTASNSTSINFEGLFDAEFDEFMFVLSNITVTSTTGAEIWAQASVSANPGPYVYAASSGDYSTANQTLNAAASAANATNNTATGMSLMTGNGTNTAMKAPGTTTGSALCGKVNLAPAANQYKHFYGQASYLNGSGNAVQAIFDSVYKSTSAVTALKFYASNGNIAGGTLAMYGLRK